MMALATRYDVSAQVASSVVAAMLLAMCGSDTLTTVVSSTSMKVANMTATATIHGLTGVAHARLSGRPPTGVHGRRTDMPGRSRCSGSWLPSSTIFTGTRCTTLTKLPLAFSGGSRLKRDPVAAAMLSTLPVNAAAAVGVHLDRHQLSRHACPRAASP